MARSLLRVVAIALPTAVRIVLFLAAAIAPAAVAWAKRTVVDRAATRTITRERQLELPGHLREPSGRLIRFQATPRRHVREEIVDGPVDQAGRFVRTFRTVTTKAIGREPLRRPVGPTWTAEEAPYLYSSKALGPLFGDGDVRVRLFAPYNRRVALVIDDTNERFEMTPDDAAVWEATLATPPDRLAGKRYHFEVDGTPIDDPYAHITRDGKSIFPIPGPARTRVPFRAPAPADLVVSEAHVADETLAGPVPAKDAGRYLGLAAAPVTDHYARLGTAVQLMPVHEYDREGGGHFGYSTTQFLAPTSRFASAAEQAPSELKAAIDALHGRGVPVLMDVVYNHTGNQERLHFKLLGRSYYYRFGDDGALRNRAGTGNELATERPMVRKLIIDSLRHFVNEYRVDGFRLDLGALLDKRTLLVIDRALPRRVFLTAEPWSYEPGMWGKGDDDVARTRLTLWNDDYRNHVGDFVTGTGDPGRARAAILGGVYPSGWVKRPEDLQGARWRHQSMNYLESHDELKIADRVGHDVGRAGMAILLLAASQGPFMLGHRQETLQGKDGLHNTWQVPSPVSWENTPERERLFAFTSALVAIHKAFPHFRFPRPLAAPDHEVLETANEHALGFLLRPPRAAPGRKGLPDFLVLANGDTRPRDQAFAWEHFKLPPGTWRVVADSDTTRALDPDAIKQGAALHTAEGNYSVAPGRAVILALGR